MGYLAFGYVHETSSGSTRVQEIASDPTPTSKHLEIYKSQYLDE